MQEVQEAGNQSRVHFSPLLCILFADSLVCLLAPLSALTICVLAAQQQCVPAKHLCCCVHSQTNAAHQQHKLQAHIRGSSRREACFVGMCVRV